MKGAASPWVYDEAAVSPNSTNEQAQFEDHIVPGSVCLYCPNLHYIVWTTDETSEVVVIRGLDERV